MRRGGRKREREREEKIGGWEERVKGRQSVGKHPQENRNSAECRFRRSRANTGTNWARASRRKGGIWHAPNLPRDYREIKTLAPTPLFPCCRGFFWDNDCFIVSRFERDTAPLVRETRSFVAFAPRNFRLHDFRRVTSLYISQRYPTCFAHVTFSFFSQFRRKKKIIIYLLTLPRDLLI